MPRITKVNKGSVTLNEPVRDRRGGESTEIRRENVAITDPAIGLLPGTEIDKDLNWYVTKYAPTVPLLGGKEPKIEQNPYNFVEMPASGPWLDSPSGKRHPGHTHRPNLLSGRIQCTLQSLTPVFVPKGEERDQKERDASKDQNRDFLQLHRAGGAPHFAIAGASFKGVLRSGVEALANDRIRIDKNTLGNPIPFRRRVFADGATPHRPGELASTGILKKFIPGNNIWLVQEVAIVYLNSKDRMWERTDLSRSFSYEVQEYNHRKMAVPGSGHIANDVRPFRGNLLWTENADHPAYTHIIVRTIPGAVPFQLPKVPVDLYAEMINLEDGHHRRHYDNADKVDRDTKFFKYRGKMPPFDSVRKDLARMDENELIYFTYKEVGLPKAPARVITSFGKNINYIWPAYYLKPADHSPAKLAEKYERDEENKPFSLGQPLGMAERLFGFSAKHDGEKSHPFRGKVRTETLWGPPADRESKILTTELTTAPLTSPATRAKARPLYLEGRQDGTSASYSDASPRLMGRKFFWHQRPDNQAQNTKDGLWKLHLKDAEHAPSQLQPPIKVLPAGTSFTGFLHFHNLSQEELGALLFALGGPPAGPGRYDHCLKVGKGKPRGMGSMRPTINRVEFRNPHYYDTLDADAKPYVEANTTETADAHTKFKQWCVDHASGIAFDTIPHIQDYMKLHTWPSRPSIRLYPINFKDYGWLPKENFNPDEPKGARPKSLARARELKPECP